MNTQIPVPVRRIIIVAAICFVAGATMYFADSRTANRVRQSEIPKEAAATVPARSDMSESARVTFVIDGDTVEIEGGQRVRYIGIDTPESAIPDKPDECYGKESAAQNKALVAGRVIRMEKDISDTDSYGRLLRYVYADGVMVNDYLVRQGFARASAFPPDIRYAGQFAEAQNEARENSRGLWSQCGN